jgi:hypothetical protein
MLLVRPMSCFGTVNPLEVEDFVNPLEVEGLVGGGADAVWLASP